MNGRTKAEWALTIMIGACVSITTQAQQSSPNSPGANADDGQLAEIIVTAEKHEASLSTTGLAITALQGETLLKLGIQDAHDLALSVPGFTVATTNVNVPVYTLRGVGFYDTTLSAYPDVSVYVDEVPLPFPVLASHAQFDDSRVEVLKGPQGTLFGANSTGGAINYVAEKPSKDPGSGADITYGRFNTFIGEGFVTGPVTNSITARFSVRVEEGDGWQTSYTRPDEHNGEKRLLESRVALDWTATDNLTVKLNVTGWGDRGQAQAPQLSALAIQVPAFASAALTNYPLSPHRDTAADWSTPITIGTGDPHAIGDSDNFGLASTRIEYKINDDLELTSLTSFIDFERDDYLGSDGVSLAIQDNHSIARTRTIMQEVRLSGEHSSATRWITGLNYEQDDTFERLQYSLNDATVAQELGLKSGEERAAQNMKNYAVFGNIEQDVLPTLTAKAGARFTQSDRDFTGCDADTGDGTIATFFTGLYRALTNNPNATAIQPGSCITFNQNFLPGPVSSHLNQNNVSWRVGLDWKPQDNTLIYGNIAKGFKAGSYPQVDGATYAQYRPVVQESVLDYELGEKITFLDRRLYVDSSVFHYDYTNKQLDSQLVDPIFGLLETLVNVPKSTVNGVETAVTWRASRGLTLSVAGSYLDAKITRFTGVNNDGENENFAGSAVPFTPKWQVTANADYETQLGSSGLTGSIGAGANFSSATNALFGYNPDFDIASYTLLNLRAGVASEDGKWRVLFWGKNVTDRYYWTNVVRDTDVVLRYAGMPATYGVTVSFRSH